MKAVITSDAVASIKRPAMVSRNSLADILIELRMRAGMTQHAVAEAIALTRASVANMETGRQTVALEHVEALALHLGLQVTVTITPTTGNGGNDDGR